MKTLVETSATLFYLDETNQQNAPELVDLEVVVKVFNFTSVSPERYANLSSDWNPSCQTCNNRGSLRLNRQAQYSPYQK